MKNIDFLKFWLPLELWIKIASISPKIWLILVQTVPMLGRWSLKPHIQIEMKKLFVKCRYNHNPFLGWVQKEWNLQNGCRYRGDDLPAVIVYKTEMSHNRSEPPSEDDNQIGAKIWYSSGNGKRYRDEGKPAFIRYYDFINELQYKKGEEYKVWYKNGKKLREEGKRTTTSKLTFM